MNVQAIVIQAGIELARLAISEFSQHVTKKSFAQFLCRVSNGSLCPDRVDEGGEWKCTASSQPAVHLILSSDVDDLVTVMHPHNLFDMAANYLEWLLEIESRGAHEKVLSTVDDVEEFLTKELFRFAVLLRESNEDDDAYDLKLDKQAESIRDLELAYYLEDANLEDKKLLGQLPLFS